MKTRQATAAPFRGQTESKKAVMSPKPTNGALANQKTDPVTANGDEHEIEENFTSLNIDELEKVNGKDRFEIHSDAVIKVKSGFGDKLLCDGPTFTAGHACTFSCTFCFVPGMLWANKRLNHIKKGRGENIIVEIADAAKKAREFLATGGDSAKPKFKHPADQRVIYASPLVDVAGTMHQVKVTIGICLEILQLTHWQIRLLSKNSLLLEVAKKIPDEYKSRMIFGFSTGTLDSDLAETFEIGTGKVSKRLEALKWLQANGYRTFGMLCPILPQKDYAELARQVAATREFDQCEHIWAEVLNERGGSLSATIEALRAGKRIEEADLLAKVVSDKVERVKYEEQTFLALAKVLPPGKLRLMQYVDEHDYSIWEPRQDQGAILLGKYAKEKRQRREECEKVIRTNLKEFILVGRALKEIRDSKLYRLNREFSSFEEYCLATFDFSLSQGKRLVKAAEVADDLQKTQAEENTKTGPSGPILMPATEVQARVLAKITDSKKRLAVLRAATDKAKIAGGKAVNSKFIQAAAAEITGRAPKPSPAACYIPKTYTTDLDVFLSWVADLKQLAAKGKRAELLEQLTKAERDQAIIPELDVVPFTADDLQTSWFSTLSEHDVEYREQIFSVEGLFNWLLFAGHPEIQKVLAKQKTPLEARVEAMRSRHLLPALDETTAVDLMRQCMQLKIEQHPYLLEKLMATGEKVLVLDCTANPKGDDFIWGMAKVNQQWVGKNWLGRLWMELRAEKPSIKPIKPLPDNKFERLRLYGKNRSQAGGGKSSYRTNISLWIDQRRQAIKRRPFYVNVTSNGAKTELNFTSLSPMLMGPAVACYLEAGKMLTSVSVEVAWQYSKVYSHSFNTKTGLPVDLKGRFITKKDGKDYPSDEWFGWRNAAYCNWEFDPNNPDMDKDGVRRGFPKGSPVAFWYWAGEVIYDRVEARKRIYTTLYQKHLLQSPAFHKLRDIFNGTADEPARDLMIFDYDGYDWIGLDMTPTECLLDDHSFGHGLVISLNLVGIDPTKIETKPIEEKYDLKLNWINHYDNYDWKSGRQRPINDRRRKAIEDMAVKVLELNPGDLQPSWGIAHPPGCFAQTVIEVTGMLRNRYAEHGKIGFKIFNYQRGMNEWGRLKKFYAEYKDRLPGLKENQQVQKVFTWGTYENQFGVRRAYLVQEWIEGATLDELIKQGLKRKDILKILEDLFLKLLIPLWGQGLKWWDARGSNYVYNPKRGLVMIDPDSLADFAEEIVTTPGEYKKRNECNPDQAIARYTTLITNLALACSDGKPDQNLKKNVRSLFSDHLDAHFRNAKYPLPADWSEKATAAYAEFQKEYQKLLVVSGGAKN